MLADALDINRHSIHYDISGSVQLEQLYCTVHGDYLDHMWCNKILSN
jgi:hypothetical protein